MMTAPFSAAMASESGAPQHMEVVTAPTVKVVNGLVEINVNGEENRQVYVFSLTGQLVKTVTATPGTTTIDLPAGYYIVKCDRISQRVIVR